LEWDLCAVDYRSQAPILEMQAGSVSDQASKTLADVRARRRDNTEALRKLMDEQARALLQMGASDSKMVSLMRGRFCVGIKVCGSVCVCACVCCLSPQAASRLQGYLCGGIVWLCVLMPILVTLAVAFTVDSFAQRRYIYFN
jgi:hypothetical protein